jgi:hypothetical protein
MTGLQGGALASRLQARRHFLNGGRCPLVVFMMLGLLGLVAFLCLSNMVLEIIGVHISKNSAGKRKNNPQEAARH